MKNKNLSKTKQIFKTLKIVKDKNEKIGEKTNLKKMKILK